MLDFNSKWCLIYTKPKSEKKTAKYLEELSIDHLLPLHSSVHQWQDRKKIVHSPIFPSYLFVNLSSAKAYFEILDLNSVINFVKIGNEVATVQEKTVENIRIIMNQNCNVSVSTDNIKIGKKILIKEGPFLGLDCEIVKIGDKGSLLVRIDIFKRQLLFDIPREYGESYLEKYCKINYQL